MRNESAIGLATIGSLIAAIAYGWIYGIAEGFAVLGVAWFVIGIVGLLVKPTPPWRPAQDRRSHHPHDRASRN